MKRKIGWLFLAAAVSTATTGCSQERVEKVLVKIIEELPNKTSEKTMETESESASVSASESALESASESTPESVADLDTESDSDSVVISAEEQLAVILKNRTQWEGVDESGIRIPYYSYAVTDLNQNGRLEVICSVMQGSGHFSYNLFFEVNEEGDGLKQCNYDENRQEGDSEADIVTDSVPVYYDADRSVYYYVFDDFIRGGIAEQDYNKRALSLEDGVIRETPLAYQSVVFHGDNMEVPEISCADAEGNAISEEEYNQIADQVYSGLEKGTAKIAWFTPDELVENGTDGERGGDITDEEFEMWLRESWNAVKNSLINY